MSKEYSQPSMSEMGTPALDVSLDETYDNQWLKDNFIDDNRTLCDAVLKPDTDSYSIDKAFSKQLVSDFIACTTVPQHPFSVFDEKEFVCLLALSSSLSLREKESMIQAIPILSQQQIDALMESFRNELKDFQRPVKQKTLCLLGELGKLAKIYVNRLKGGNNYSTES